MKPEILFEDLRAGVTECLHHGSVCVMGEKGVCASFGDTDFTCFYRSASKPFQALPVLLRDLPKQYGLTEEEIAIFSGSIRSDEAHTRVLTSILDKTGLKEEDMIMKPAYPNNAARRDHLKQDGLPPRKLYHNCAGKHLALMLLARSLGEDVRDYWRRESKTQAEVLNIIARMSDTPETDIRIGVDGCGVPVFAVPFTNIAKSFYYLARPEALCDEKLERTVRENVARLHRYPNMLAGEGAVVSMMSADPDIICKSGALGLFCFGIHSLELGVAVKMIDGNHDVFPEIAVAMLRELGVAEATAQHIRERFPASIINDNDEIVGERRYVGKLTKTEELL